MNYGSRFRRCNELVGDGGGAFGQNVLEITDSSAGSDKVTL